MMCVSKVRDMSIHEEHAPPIPLACPLALHTSSTDGQFRESFVHFNRAVDGLTELTSARAQIRRPTLERK